MDQLKNCVQGFNCADNTVTEETVAAMPYVGNCVGPFR